MQLSIKSRKYMKLYVIEYKIKKIIYLYACTYKYMIEYCSSKSPDYEGRC